MLGNLGLSLLALGCNPSRPPEPPVDPSQASTVPQAAEVEIAKPEGDACPSIEMALCDAYLRTVAECSKRVTGKMRQSLRDEARKHCQEWHEPVDDLHWRLRQVACKKALVNLLDEPACQLQTATELCSALPAAQPWCGETPAPPVESDPAGAVQIVVRSELSSLLPLRSVVVAVDGVGLLVRNLGPDDTSTVLAGGMLASFRGWLSPGAHAIRLFVRLRVNPSSFPGSDPDMPILAQQEECITIHENTAVTVAAVLSDRQNAFGAKAPISTRFELR